MTREGTSISTQGRLSAHITLLREFSVPLIAGVVVALIWANVAPVSYRSAIDQPLWGSFSLRFWTNEVFMAFFFGLAAVEIVDSLRPGGHLNPPSKAVVPLLATAGGVVGPALLFIGMNAVVGLPAYQRGWGIVTATDIALAWLVARIIFGSGHPAISFLLVLAIADDAIGLAIIAIFYPDPAHPVRLLPLLLVVGGMVIAGILRRLRVNNYWPYLLAGGTLSWFGLHEAHLHPALALVFIIPILPHQLYPGDETSFDVHPEEQSALGRFERDWKVIVDFGLFLFGLCSAGVEFSEIGTITWQVFIALLVGKTVGVSLLALIGNKLGYALPERIGRRELLMIGLIAGIGLTVSLFIANAAFAERSLRDAAKMGALFSGSIGLIAPLVARLLGIHRQAGAAAVTPPRASPAE